MTKLLLGSGSGFLTTPSKLSTWTNPILVWSATISRNFHSDSKEPKDNSSKEDQSSAADGGTRASTANASVSKTEVGFRSKVFRNAERSDRPPFSRCRIAFFLGRRLRRGHLFYRRVSGRILLELRPLRRLAGARQPSLHGPDQQLYRPHHRRQERVCRVPRPHLLLQRCRQRLVRRPAVESAEARPQMFGLGLDQSGDK